MVQIATKWSTAQIYLYGAHVARFKKHDEEPLLFLSERSSFEIGKPIRGGIPVIFPWFGQAQGKPGMHGWARTTPWELAEIASIPDGSVTLRFRLPEPNECPACIVEYVVTIADSLGTQLNVTNRSAGHFEFEDCLHTYFGVGDIAAVSIAGLKGVDYLDKVEGFRRKTETNDAINIASEVDRIYVGAPQTVEIRDSSLKRIIRIAKENSASTVVWNPWITKAKAMPDFGDEEYKQMVCVESGNVSLDKIKLPPGETSRLKVEYSSASLK